VSAALEKIYSGRWVKTNDGRGKLTDDTISRKHEEAHSQQTAGETKSRVGWKY
jgi:uncharacterized protein YjbJ (UPF0337 family)